MAQANSIANNTPTRRNALTTIAALAGAAAVVTPAVAAHAVAHPDAEVAGARPTATRDDTELRSSPR
jgi:hypothetical protein